MTEVILTSCVLLLLLIGLRYLMRGKISLRLQYALWLVAALRLLLPFQIGSLSFSVSSLTEDTSAAVTHIMTQPIRPAQTEIVLPDVPVGSSDVGVSQTPAADTMSPMPAIASPTVEAPAALTVGEVVKIVWLSGVGLMAVWFVAVNLIHNRKARRNAETISVEDCPLPVRVSDGIWSPCLLGFFRPAVYLTRACTEDPHTLHHVISHELTHYRHKDQLWSVVRALCLCLHWYNPLVWWAASLSRRDCELACDEGTLNKLGEEERIPYGMTLLRLIEHAATPAYLLQTATTMAAGKRQLKERITRIGRKPKLYTVVSVCLLFVVLTIAGCAFAGVEKVPELTMPSTEGQETEALLSSDEVESTLSAVPTPPSTEKQEGTAPSINDAYRQPLDMPIHSSYAADVTRIPMLLIAGNGTEENSAEAQLLWWDLENHAVTGDGEVLFRLNESYSSPEVWVGDKTFLLSAASLEDCAEEVICKAQTKGYTYLSYGHCYYKSDRNGEEEPLLCEFTPDGGEVQIALPKIPLSELGFEEDMRGIHSQPVYATVVDNTAFVAYIYYDNICVDGEMTEYSELICAAYPADMPESAQWSVVNMPSETRPSVLCTEHIAALIGSKLYIPSFDNIVVLDLATNEIGTVAALDSLAEMFGGCTYYSEGGGYYERLYPLGVYEDVLIVSTNLYDGNNECHGMLVALRDGQILGALEIKRGKIIDLFDGELQYVGTSDRFATEERGWFCVPKAD